MRDVFGASETHLLHDRLEHFSDGQFSNGWDPGRFSCSSIAELVSRVAQLPPVERERLEPALTVVDGIDIGRLQASLKTEDRAMVQIASNFNCLEVASRRHLPDSGALVEGYAMDSTQGPAASFGVPAASLYRAHFVFYNELTEPSMWGQTADRQVELLCNVTQFFGRCMNGKLSLDGREQPLLLEHAQDVAQGIRVGIHEDAQVIFGRSQQGNLDLLPTPFQVVDQVLAASVNWSDPGIRPSQEQLECLTRATLRAGYDGAYLAAILRGRQLLLLTLIGGGAFMNPIDMILEELAAAHTRWTVHPASKLREVRLCLYSKNGAFMEQLLRHKLDPEAFSEPVDPEDEEIFNKAEKKNKKNDKKSKSGKKDKKSKDKPSNGAGVD